MEKALTIAMTEPMGPVHIDLPEDVSLALATDDVVRPIKVKQMPAETNKDNLTKATSLISQAERPLVVLGSSAMRMEKPELLRAFVEHHGIPFLTSTMAKGMIDDDHPLCAGCIERGRRQIPQIHTIC
jgi:acetolactate synthase-1/2/3 large subunit